MSPPRDVPVRGTQVREGDIEPYTALRWVGTLFKGAAVFLAVALLAEFIAGLRIEGLAALPLLLGELARMIVLAVVLWGGGDLVRLLIHLGHDVRAQRIILSRVAFRLKHEQEAHDRENGIDEGIAVRRVGTPHEMPRREPPAEGAAD